MKPPDSDLDTLLERFERLVRNMTKGRVTLTLEKVGGRMVDHDLVCDRMVDDDWRRLMWEIPCKRAAEAEMKRGRRR
jgi:hypothetical protein